MTLTEKVPEAPSTTSNAPAVPPKSVEDRAIAAAEAAVAAGRGIQGLRGETVVRLC